MVVLADTSVWVTHLRSGSRHLAERLEQGEVLCHPFIVGELACGNLKNRAEILALLQALPTAPLADQKELLAFIDANDLAGRGIGLVDAHLLASARLAGAPLWTTDRRLKAAAQDLGIAYADAP